MPRPKKCRKICAYPKVDMFYPKNQNESKVIQLTYDEYEAIRLMDYEGCSQEQCAKIMQVARTTVTQIYSEARKKLACALVEGHAIQFTGGDVFLCSGHDQHCIINSSSLNNLEVKNMKLAVAYENGEVFQHFGHTETFKIYEIEDGKVISSEVIPTNGQGHGALAGFLSMHHVDVLICGGIGMGARNALAQANVTLIPGVNGNVDKAVENYLSGSLMFNPNIVCNHHHDENHDCHSHDCGEEHDCHSHDCGGHCH